MEQLTLFPTDLRIPMALRDAIRELGGTDTPNEIVRPPAVGTWTRFSDAGTRALAVAEANGVVHRGGADDQATVSVINSLAKRGAVTPVIVMEGRRKVTTGATITAWGRKVLAEAAAAADAAERRARILAG